MNILAWGRAGRRLFRIVGVRAVLGIGLLSSGLACDDAAPAKPRIDAPGAGGADGSAADPGRDGGDRIDVPATPPDGGGAGGGSGDGAPETAGEVGGGDLGSDAPAPGPVDVPPEAPPCSCPAPKVCSNGGVCACPAVAASPVVGGGCTTAGAQVCGGGAILTCTADAASGCLVLVKGEDCAATGLECGQLAGPPTCRCASPTNEISVDPVAGNDSGAREPTGAANPPACRFKTIGRAVQLANMLATRPLRIVARSATRPVVFEGETFPIVLRPYATLGTDDPGLDPANYRLVFRGPAATSALVSLGNDSGIEGFTLEAAAGAAENGVLVPVSGSVRGVRILASGTGSIARGVTVGADSRPSAVATLERLTIERAMTGLFVTTQASAPITATTVTIEDAALGVSLQEGTLMASALTIQKSAAGSAGFGVKLTGGAGLARLVASNLVIKDLSRTGIDATGQGMAPQVVLTGGEIARTTESAVNIEAGSFSATGTNIHGTSAWGLELGGSGVTATLGAGTKVDGNRFGGIVVRTGATLTGTGVSASRNRVGDGSLSDGLHVEGGTATLHQSVLDENEGRAVYVDGGSATVDDGSLMRGNGRTAGSSSIRHKAGTLVLGGAAGGVTEISGSGRHGIYVWTDEGTGTGAISVTRTKLSGHLANGLFVDVVPGGASAAVNVVDSELSGNEANGVRVDRAAALGGAPGVRLLRTTIAGNGKTANDGNGVVINGLASSVVALDSCIVRDNRSTGVLVQQGAGATVSVAFENNDVTGNNTGGEAAIAGLHFATASTLSSFRGNKVHANLGHELGFAAASNGGGWTLGTGACDGGANRISCYGGAAGSGKVGVFLTGTAAFTVNAGGTIWQTASPALGVDWNRAAGAAGSVTTTGACAPVATCP